MALNHIFVNNFRNLSEVTVNPVTMGFNFFYGQNGSGKTSFLEAIYYLGHKRSFRSLQTDRLIRYSTEQFHLFSKILDNNTGQIIPLGIERSQDGEFRARLAGQDITTIPELAAALPMRLINVHSHHLLEGAPVFRRKYLDWGIFYQNQAFHGTWFKFQRLLKQRNAALKARSSFPELTSWTQQFSEIASSFHELRQGYVQALLPLLQYTLSKRAADFFDISGLTIDYHPGWDVTQNLEEILRNSLARDVERGHTHYGPHRADLSVKISGIPAKDVLSTGQQKLLVCGMILAQGALLATQVNKKPIYLVDDLPAELDKDSRRWLIATLAEQEAQVFVTAVEQEAMSEILAQMNSPVRMFHVKHGEIEEKTMFHVKHET